MHIVYSLIGLSKIGYCATEPCRHEHCKWLFFLLFHPPPEYFVLHIHFCAVAHLTAHFKWSSLALWICSLQAERVNSSDVVQYGIYVAYVLPEGKQLVFLEMCFHIC